MCKLAAAFVMLVISAYQKIRLKCALQVVIQSGGSESYGIMQFIFVLWLSLVSVG